MHEVPSWLIVCVLCVQVLVPIPNTLVPTGLFCLSWWNAPQMTTWPCALWAKRPTLKSISSSWWASSKLRLASVIRTLSTSSRWRDRVSYLRVVISQMHFWHFCLIWRRSKPISTNILFSVPLFHQKYQETELARQHAEVLSVSTYLQRPLERIETYRSLLKVCFHEGEPLALWGSSKPRFEMIAHDLIHLMLELALGLAAL